MKNVGMWNNSRGNNLLDGGAPFYRCYQCKCGKFMAVGSLEPQFYKGLLVGMGYKGDNLKEMI